MPLTTNEKEYSKNSFKKGKYYRSKIYCQRNTGILIVHKQLKIFQDLMTNVRCLLNVWLKIWEFKK